MSYADALADLKADFGKKKLLTPEEIAPYISKSASAQASMRSRKQFPIAQKDVGGRVMVSIYDLARFIGGDDTEPQPSLGKPSTTAKTQAVSKSVKTAKSVDKTKPIRRPPSLGKTLTVFRKRINDAATQLHFQQALFAALEAIEFDKAIALKETVRKHSKL